MAFLLIIKIILIIGAIIWINSTDNLKTKKTILTVLLVYFLISGFIAMAMGKTPGLAGILGAFLPAIVAFYYLNKYSKS